MITARTNKIDKKHVTATVLFAINNIPNADRFTLNKFLELMNTGGSFGLITTEQLLEIGRLMIKYVPGVCQESLQVVLELLGIHLNLNLKNKALAGDAGPVEKPEGIPVKPSAGQGSNPYGYHPLYSFAKFLNLL